MVLQAQCISPCYSYVSVWWSLEQFGCWIEQFPAHLWSSCRYLSAPPPPLPCPLLTLTTVNDWCLEDCMRAYGWVWGLPAMGAFTVTVEAPGISQAPIFHTG